MLKMSKLLKIGKIQAEISLDEVEEKKPLFYPVKIDLWSKFSKGKTQLRVIIIWKTKFPLNLDVKNVQNFSNRSIRSRDIVW